MHPPLDIRRAAAIAAIVVLGACTDSTAPERRPPGFQSDPEALQELVERSLAVSLTIERPNERDLANAAASIPGLAGIQMDNDGNLVVLTVGEVDQGNASQVALDLLRRTGRPLTTTSGRPVTVKFRKVRYSFEQLAGWRDALLLPVMEGARADFLDLDEDRNAVVIGVKTEEARRYAEAVLSTLQYPADAFIVEHTAGASEIADLTVRWRPLMGGIRFGRLDQNMGLNSCTLGIPVIWNSQRGFLTASHCTRWRNTPDFEPAWQPWYASSSIGTEIFDRSGSSCGSFNSRNCRHADVAMFGLQTLDSLPGEVGFSVGRIARTLTPAPGIGDGYGSREVTGSWNAAGMFSYPFMNETLHKVGYITGWTYGRVYKTCVTKDIPGYRYWCQDFVEVNGEPGDSGSPVFKLYADAYTGEPYATAFFMGILWAADAAAGPNHSGGIFGNVSQIQLEMGSFQVTP